MNTAQKKTMYKNIFEHGKDLKRVFNLDSSVDEIKLCKKLFSIENLSSGVNLKIGDEIFSSGLGGKFPKGYLIGKVKRISNDPNLKFQTVEVQSTAVFDNGSKVLFISP